MNRRLITSILAIATVACSIPLVLSIHAGNALWIVLSCVLILGCFIGWMLTSRCPHCGRVIDCTFLKRRTICCHYCGGKVDLNEGILHPKE